MPFNKRTEETREEFDKAWQEFLAMHGSGTSLRVAPKQRRSTKK